LSARGFLVEAPGIESQVPDDHLERSGPAPPIATSSRVPYVGRSFRRSTLLGQIPTALAASAEAAFRYPEHVRPGTGELRLLRERAAGARRGFGCDVVVSTTRIE